MFVHPGNLFWSIFFSANFFHQKSLVSDLFLDQQKQQKSIKLGLYTAQPQFAKLINCADTEFVKSL